MRHIQSMLIRTVGENFVVRYSDSPDMICPEVHVFSRNRLEFVCSMHVITEPDEHAGVDYFLVVRNHVKDLNRTIMIDKDFLNRFVE